MKKIKQKKAKVRQSTIRKTGQIQLDPVMKECLDMGVKLLVLEQDKDEDNVYYLDLVEAGNIDWNKAVK